MPLGIAPKTASFGIGVGIAFICYAPILLLLLLVGHHKMRASMVAGFVALQFSFVIAHILIYKAYCTERVITIPMAAGLVGGFVLILALLVLISLKDFHSIK